MQTIRYIEIIFSFVISLLLAIVAFSDTYIQVPSSFFLPIIDIKKQLWPIYLTYCFFIIAITLYEVIFLRILDIFTLPGIIIAIFLSYFFDNKNLFSHILGIFSASFLLYILDVICFMLTNKGCVGGGVIKLSAMIGAFIGVFNTIISLLLAALIAIPYFYFVYRFKGQKVVEVGPLLSIFSLTTIIFPYDKFVEYVINLAR